MAFSVRVMIQGVGIYVPDDSGEPATMGTLWPVKDHLLPSLQETFHRGILDGLKASEALRGAQLEAARNPDMWAALQLIGGLPALAAPTP